MCSVFSVGWYHCLWHQYHVVQELFGTTVAQFCGTMDGVERQFPALPVWK